MNLHFNKLKSAITNVIEVTLNLSLNLIRSSNDVSNFPHILLLTDIKVSKIRKVFANGSSANINFSKTLLSKIVQSGGFMGLLDLFILILYYLYILFTWSIYNYWSINKFICKSIKE